MDCSRRAIVQDRWVEAGRWGIYTRVTDVAEHAPTIVLVHGNVVSSRYMEPLARALADNFSVYMLDLPGFGKSAKPPHTLRIDEQADVLATWMEAVGLERAAFVGNSFGCQVLVEFVRRHPERVSRLVLQGPTVDPWARTLYQQGARFLLDCTCEAPSYGLVVVQDFLAAGLRRTWTNLQYLLADRIEAKLPHIEVPALVVRGSRDAIVPQRWAREVAGLLPSGRLRVVRGAPHAMPYTTPTGLARVIREFLLEEMSSRSPQRQS